MSNLAPAERLLGTFSAVSALLWLVLGLSLGGASDAPFAWVMGGVTAAVCGLVVAVEPRNARPVLMAPCLGLLAGGLALVAAGEPGLATLAMTWGGTGIALEVAAARSVNGRVWRGGPPG